MKKVIDLIVLGAGNPDIVRLIEEVNDCRPTYNFLGFLEKDETKAGSNVYGYPIIGDDDLLKTEFKHCAVVNNIMSTPIVHAAITEKLLNEYGLVKFPSLIHPSVQTKYVEVGQGNIIYENVNLGVSVTIGNFNIIYPGSFVGHETKIKDSNLLAASVLIGARCNVGSNIFFGNRSTLIPGLNICDNSFIGAGSVVIMSINRAKKVFGVPAVKQQ